MPGSRGCVVSGDYLHNKCLLVLQQILPICAGSTQHTLSGHISSQQNNRVARLLFSHLQSCLSAITENMLCIKLGKYFPYQTVTGESSDVSEFDPIEIFNKRCHLIWGKCWKWQPGKRIQSSEKWEQVRAGAIKRVSAILNFQNFWIEHTGNSFWKQGKTE